MNGDMSCIVCDKTIPRATEYGHMLEVHGWDYDKYRNQYCRGPEPLKWQMKDFEGYNPIIIAPDINWLKNFAIVFLLSTAVALYFSTKIAIGIIALQILIICFSMRDKGMVEEYLNGMIEQLRLRISDLEEKVEDKRIPPII